MGVAKPPGAKPPPPGGGGGGDVGVTGVSVVASLETLSAKA